MRAAFGAWVMIGGLASATLACGAATPSPCAQQPCESGVRIELRSARAQWNDGHYRVELRSDGRRVACELQIAAGRAESARCDGERARWELSLESAPRALVLLATPERLQITVAHERTELARAEFLPSYVQNSPNGPGCAPSCAQGRELELALP